LKVKYLGSIDTVALTKGKIYNVISIERGWFRIMTELDDDYLFPPELFEVVTDEKQRSQSSKTKNDALN